MEIYPAGSIDFLEKLQFGFERIELANLVSFRNKLKITRNKV